MEAVRQLERRGAPRSRSGRRPGRRCSSSAPRCRTGCRSDRSRRSSTNASGIVVRRRRPARPARASAGSARSRRRLAARRGRPRRSPGSSRRRCRRRAPWPADRRGRQDRQVGRRPAEDLEQVARQRVDPVAVLEHEDRPAPRRDRAPQDDRAAGPRATPSGASRPSPRSATCPGSRRPTTAPSERRALDELRVDRRERRPDPVAPGRASASSSSSAEQAAPDLAPDEVARVRAERLALAERDEEAAPARDPDELRDQPRLAHAGVGRDADDPPVAGDRQLAAPSSRRGQLVAPADEVELVAGLAARRALERAGQARRPRSWPPCP